jgi:serine/threonine protein kinase/tetratricopeptide (TPR) repeat protein
LRADDRALADLAASVADGSEVDWRSAESQAGGTNLRLVRHLRLVENIASLYRSIPADAADEEPAINNLRSSPGEAEPEGPRWGQLVMIERIGQGTSCEVFRAWDSELHREVALKLLHDVGFGGPAGTSTHDRVLNEARRLARVRHPHVVQVYGAEEHDGRVGLWMELVRGESLEHIVHARGPFGPREAAVVGQDLCAALAAVHGAGLVHRDVKAQNVLRESGGRTVLMDFGTGEELGDAKATARMAGTPLYLAPEIFAGQPASVQSDLYGLGVLLFYLVTGQFPVTAGSIEQLARAHAHKQMRRLRDLRPDLPSPFVRAVERALEHDPATRYSTAGEMEAALRDGADGFPTSGVAASTRSISKWPALAPWIAVAVAVIAIVAAIVWSRTANRFGPAAPHTITSIAVLPLKDDSAAATPYFADALTDQLITTLGQISSLRVASRTSVMPFKESAIDRRKVIEALGVDAYIEGSVVVVPADASGPGRVRLNTGLIAAGTGEHLWAKTLERPLGDALALEADLARHVVQAVRATITAKESARLTQTPSTNPAAEEAYFQGRYHLGQFGVERARRALEAFNRAVTLDPRHAAAHAGAARAYFTLGFTGAMSQTEARQLALEQVSRALDIDEDQAEAQVALGDLRFLYDWNWKGADAAYRKAIELNSSFSYARTQYARFLAASRRLPQAVDEAKKAETLDPLSADSAQSLGLILYYKRDYGLAIHALERALQLDPGSARAQYVLGRVYDAQGRGDQAIETTRKAVEMSDDAGVSWQMQLIRLHAEAGRRDEALAQLGNFMRNAEARHLRVAAEHLAYVYLALKDEQKGLEYLERAVRDRDPGVLWLGVDPRVDSVRQHPRFVALIDLLGIP